MYELLWSNLNHGNVFADDLMRQLKRNFNRFMISLVLLYWVYPFANSLFSPYELGWQLWRVAFLFSASAIACTLTSHLSYIVALIGYQIILFVVVTQTLLISHVTSLMWFYLIIPVMGSVFSGWRVGLMSIVMMFLSVLSLPQLQPFLGDGHVAWLILLTAMVCGIVAIVLAPLFGMLDWAATYYKNTQQDLTIARQDRATVRRTLHTVNSSVRSLERANSELIVAQQTAEKAEQFKTQFVRHLSHEFRTPLNLILGFTDMMINSPESYGVDLPRQYRSDVRTLHRSSKHLMELVNQVLDLARIETGKVTISPTLVSVHQIIDEVRTMMESHIRSKGLSFEVTCSHVLPDTYLDAVRIRQVLLNLLANAVRFTETGTITLSVSDGETSLKFEVSDTGKGIAKDDLESIFQPYQTSEVNNAWYDGTGLGLSITKQLIELHGGEITVESAVGVGTTFHFSLPIQQLTVVSQLPQHSEIFSQHQTAYLRRRAVVVYHTSTQLIAFLKSSLHQYDIIQARSWLETVELTKIMSAIAVIAPNENLEGDLPASVLLITIPFPVDELYADDQYIRGVLVKPFTKTDIQLLIDRSGRSINRILVADDDPDIVRLIRRMLQGEFSPMDILAAHNGLEALDMIATQQPDMVLLDMLMPELDGQGVLDQLRLRANATYPEIVIMSATHSRLEDVPIRGVLQMKVHYSDPLYELTSLLHQTLSIWC